METVSTPVTVADVMTRSPETVGPNDYLLDAAKVMTERGVRHLPVIDDERKAVGILSDRDVQVALRKPKEFARPLGADTHGSLVSDAMSKPPLRVWAAENCASVAALFVQFRASAALVTSRDGTLEGIVSYVDLLRTLFPSSASTAEHFPIAPPT